MIIDAHQHVWDLQRASYDWLGPALAPINRSIGFEEAAPELRAAGVDRTVLVQAADNDEDTRAMLEVADAHPEVAGIVAYVPLDLPETAAKRLETLAADPRVVGVRNLIHDQPDPDWILRPEVDDGLGLLETAGLPFDYVAVLPRHLEHIPHLGAQHPGLQIVIDHLGKPPIGGSARWKAGEWEELMHAAAANPNVYAKISGLYSATSDPAAWTIDTVRPFVEFAFERFGADRLMYGGDWPVSITAGGYRRIWAALSSLITEMTSPTEREDVLAGSAVRFYGLSLAD